MRWVFLVASGILIGFVLHIVSLLAVPVLAPRDAYHRLEAIGAENVPILLDVADPAKALPFQDPAFVQLACRFNLSPLPVRLRVPLAGDYVSISFHDRNGTAFFALNDRSALGALLDVEIRDANDETSKALPLGAGTISVASPGSSGFVIVRAYAPWPSEIADVREHLSKTICEARS